MPCCVDLLPKNRFLFIRLARPRGFVNGFSARRGLLKKSSLRPKGPSIRSVVPPTDRLEGPRPAKGGFSTAPKSTTCPERTPPSCPPCSLSFKLLQTTNNRSHHEEHRDHEETRVLFRGRPRLPRQNPFVYFVPPSCLRGELLGFDLVQRYLFKRASTISPFVERASSRMTRFRT